MSIENFDKEAVKLVKSYKGSSKFYYTDYMSSIPHSSVHAALLLEYRVGGSKYDLIDIVFSEHGLLTMKHEEEEDNKHFVETAKFFHPFCIKHSMDYDEPKYEKKLDSFVALRKILDDFLRGAKKISVSSPGTIAKPTKIEHKTAKRPRRRSVAEAIIEG